MATGISVGLTGGRIVVRPRVETAVGRTLRAGSAKTDDMRKARIHRPDQGSLILETAWRYYHDGQNQNDIAADLDLSRGTVANYLNEARARDLVRISLKSEAFSETALSEALCKKFGLEDAFVVPAHGALTASDLLSRVARAAGDWLPGILKDGDNLGVSWGETVYEVSVAAPTHKLENVTIVQLVGTLTTPLGFAAETCSSNLAQRFGARCINLHVPLVVSTADLADRLRAEPIIARQLDATRSCNKTLFATGICTPDSHVVKVGVVSPEELQSYLAKGAAAVICGQFIDTDGRIIESELRQRMLCVDLNDMRNREMGILVSSGESRAVAIRAAIRGGFATHLVTCARTARALLDLG